VEVSYAILGDLLEALATDWRAHAPDGALRERAALPPLGTCTQQPV
jgi:hypothetical protein